MILSNTFLNKIEEGKNFSLARLLLIYHSLFLDLACLFNYDHDIMPHYICIATLDDKYIHLMCTFLLFVTKHTETIHVEARKEYLRCVNWQHRVNSFSCPKLGHFHCSTKRLDPSIVLHAIYNRDVQHLSASRYIEIIVLLDAHRPSASYITNTIPTKIVPTKFVMRERNFSRMCGLRLFIIEYLFFHFQIVHSEL